MAYGTLKADVIQSDTANVPPQFNDGNSTQIGTLCRAWVNFDGTGTVAIRASFNVSSITDNGTGDYTVNFTTALPDANYAVLGSAIYLNSGDPGILSPITLATASVRVSTGLRTTSPSDRDTVSVSVFR